MEVEDAHVRFVAFVNAARQLQINAGTLSHNGLTNGYRVCAMNRPLGDTVIKYIFSTLRTLKLFGTHRIQGTYTKVKQLIDAIGATETADSFDRTFRGSGSISALTGGLKAKSGFDPIRPHSSYATAIAFFRS
jgi:hypothetical protein